MTEKELDDLFQKTLSGHRMPVPPDMWQRVNPQKKGRRRTVFLWWGGLGVAAIAVAIGVAVWLYHKPSESKILSDTKQSDTQHDGAIQSNTIPSTQPAGTKDNLNQKELPDGMTPPQTGPRTNGIISSQATVVYRKGNDGKKEQTILSEPEDLSSKHTGKDTINDQSNRQANDDARKEGNAEVTLLNPEGEPLLNRSVQKTDSIAFTHVSPKPESKATAVKVRKIHNEKAPALEMMIAGYGNHRDVYDATHATANSLVTFGPVNLKEKTLMSSFSINARIDKPLTEHFSLKTGLQYLRTQQRTSYTYETVSQTIYINSFANDTTISASLQSGQSVVRGTYNSISLPLLIGYHTSGSKVNLGATAGVMINVLSWYKGEVPDETLQQAVAAKNTFRTNTGASLYAGLSASKQVGNFQLFAEPHIQYTLSSITKSPASFRQKITSYGFGIGIRKTLGK